jgi:hypothetical protein
VLHASLVHRENLFGRGHHVSNKRQPVPAHGAANGEIDLARRDRSDLHEVDAQLRQRVNDSLRIGSGCNRHSETRDRLDCAFAEHARDVGRVLEHRARRHDPWPNARTHSDTVPKRANHRKIAPHVADARYAIGHEQGEGRGSRLGNVHVHVPKAGHEILPTRVDHASTGGCAHGRILAEVHDPAALNDHRHPRSRWAAAAVDHGRVGERNARRARPLGERGCR